MATYAASTEVSSDRSLTEIKNTINRYKATHFGFMETPDGVQIAFQKDGRQIRFRLTLPDPNDRSYKLTATGRVASESAAKNAYDQAVRQRYRALALVVKAKLEAVESGIATLDQEFYGYLVLPSGKTVYEETSSQISASIASGGPLRLALES